MVRKTEQKSENKKRGYAKIGEKTRWKLIDRVIIKKQTIKSAAKQLKIKLSTAKAIIQKYKETGKVHMIKKDRMRKEQEALKQKIEVKQQEVTIKQEQLEDYEIKPTIEAQECRSQIFVFPVFIWNSADNNFARDWTYYQF